MRAIVPPGKGRRRHIAQLIHRTVRELSGCPGAARSRSPIPSPLRQSTCRPRMTMSCMDPPSTARSKKHLYNAPGRRFRRYAEGAELICALPVRSGTASEKPTNFARRIRSPRIGRQDGGSRRTGREAGGVDAFFVHNGARPAVCAALSAIEQASPVILSMRP